MLRHNGQKPFQMPWQAVEISPEYTASNSPISGFSVANPDGTNYHFGITAGGYGGTEYQKTWTSSGTYTDNGISTWQVGQITSLNSANKISFQYLTGGKVKQTFQSWGANMTFDILGTPISVISTPQASISVKESEESNISKIFFTNGEVEFVASNVLTEHRTDIPESPYLKEIKVFSYEGGVKTLLKNITFHYSYFKDRTNVDGRLKLDSLQMFGVANTRPQVYRFDYTTNSYSWKYGTGGSIAADADWSKQDYFGYFNNKPNNHLIDIASYNGVSILNGTADRSTDETYMKEGLLSKITYPTGGYTIFDFVANRYKNNQIEVLGGGLRVKTIKHFDGLGNQSSMKAYKYGSDAGDGVGKLSSLWSFPSSGNVGEYTFLSGPDGLSFYKSVSIGSNGLSEMSSHDGTPVYYTDVREFNEAVATTTTNGYTDYTFSFEPDVIVNTPISFVRDIEPWKRGLLLSKSVHKSDGSKLSEILNSYSDFKQDFIVNLAKVRYVNQSNTSCPACPSGMSHGYSGFYNVCQYPQLIYFTGQNKTGQRKISQTTERYYSGTSYLETIQNFLYDNYLQQSEMITLSSKGESLKTSYTHPYDYTVSPYTTMLNNNFITPVIEETSSLDNIQTFWKSTDYDIFSNHYLPQKIRTKVGAGTEITPIVFDTYNLRGNLTKYTLRSGQTTTLDWYGTTGTDKGKTDLLKSQTVGGGSTGAVLARTMSYDYFSLVGVKTITDYNGYTTNYSFDDFQRLLNIKDDKEYLLKDFRYHYANQANPTGIGVNANSELNFVLSRTARTEQTGTELSNSVDLSSTQLQYLDGLGRELQTLLWRASPDKTKDILTSTTVYDVFGRANKGILPTPSDEALGVYKPNAQTLAGTFYGGDTYPFTESVFEPSPLNRPLKQFGAGQAWRVLNNEKFVSMEYNVGGTEVWQFNIQSDGSVKGEITYPANSLYSNLTTSERGFWTKELKDKQGRIIAKMQQLNTDDVATTAYCYNDLTGNLAYVIPPEAYKKFGTGTGQITSFQESDEIFKELIFGYHFDSKNRQNEKHVPGGGWRYSVFDKHDREVMFSDDADKAKGYWQFRKFDALSREIQSGLLNGKGSTSRATLQTAFDGHNANSYETTGTDLLGYTNVSFPTGYVPVEADVMSVSHYDDYVWQTETAYNFDALTAFHTQGLAKGMMTGMLSRNIETNDWLKTVNYFDYRGKLIQSFFKNHKGNIERSETQYQFNGDVLKMNIDHEGNTETYDYEIDHMSRKKSFKHTLNGILKNVSQYQYDDLGRLKTKKLGPQNSIGSVASGSWNNTNTWQNNGLPSINDYIKINAGHTVTIDAGEAGSAGSLFNAGTLNTYGQLKLGVLPPNTSGATELQTVDYSYHIRGLRGINLDGNNNLTNKLFSMRLDYETAGFFDGNIGKQEWKSSLDNVTRSFTYGYDGSSRITSGLYVGNGTENYSLNSVTYDFNGNIKTLSRNGWKSNNTFGLVDNLNYTYNANSNKILKVDDGANDSASFSDVSGNDYVYNLDGSLVSDANKGITLIEYNYLKLPHRIVQNGIEILNQYDASGQKLKETIGSNVTDYLGNIIKKNEVIYQISHDEGRIIDSEYEYFINDHLGNLRVSFRDSAGIARISQKQDFDPYGAELQKISYLKPTWKQSDFKYSGKEFIEQTGLNDFGWRQQDPILGRMWGIDYRAEKYYNQSPMQFAMNNPILIVEVNGDTVRYVGMSNEASSELQNQINSYSNASPFFKGMMGYLQSSKNDINVTIGQTRGGVAGHYIPNEVSGGVGGTLTLLSGITITSQTIIEELAHAVQLEMKPTLYPDVASSNVEYEAKLAVGIVGQDLEKKGLEYTNPAINLGGTESTLKDAMMNGGTPYNDSKGRLDFSTSNMATSQFQSYYSKGVQGFVNHWASQGLPFGSTYTRKPSNHQPLMINSIQKAIGK
jgi:hypothetical protein